MPAEPAHLQMIQTIISRLATQSTTIKGWCVTVTAALLGLGGAITKPVITFVALYVVAAFAVLDAYYLTFERAYRRHYQNAATSPVSDWNLTITRPTITDITAALRSPTIVLLYGTSLLATSAIGLYLSI